MRISDAVLKKLEHGPIVQPPTHVECEAVFQGGRTDLEPLSVI